MPDRERWHYDKRAGLVVPVDEQGERISPPPYICRGIAPGRGPLLAAAPDLLASAEDALETLEALIEVDSLSYPDDAEHLVMMRQSADMLRAAIAKAKGGGEGG